MKQKNSLKIIQDYFRNRSRIAAIYLFGSMAKKDGGGWKKIPDIDIAILLAKRIPQAKYQTLKFSFEQDLAKLLPKEKIDCVILNRTDPDFCHEVLRYRKILVENRPEERVAFETKQELEYFDFQPTQDFFTQKVLGIRI